MHLRSLLPLLLFGCDCARSTVQAAPPAHELTESAPAPAPIAALPAVEGRLRDLIGINEPFPLPRRLVPNWSAEERARRVQQTVAQLRDLGVVHIRLHSDLYPYLNQHEHQGRQGDWSTADTFMKQVLDAGLNPLVMVGPWPGNATARYTDHYVPSDMDAYAAWLTEVVERYDGDGELDAPGLSRGVTAWEVDNEPDLHNDKPPKGGPPGVDPSRFGPPREYNEVFQRSVAAIKAASPSATVLPAGLFRPGGEHGERYLRTLYRERGFLDAVDAVNIHAYPPGRYDGVLRAIDIADDASGGRPLWITETSTSSSLRVLSERTQAADLATVFFEGLRRGVVRIYWHSLIEPPNYYDDTRRRPMSHGRNLRMGSRGDIGQRQGHRGWTATQWKLAGWTLREILGRWGDLSRSDVVPVPARDGYALRLGAEIAVWSAAEPRGPRWVEVSLPDGPVLITALVPSGRSGLDISESPTFPKRQETVVGGRLRLDLSEGPVVIAPQ